MKFLPHNTLAYYNAAPHAKRHDLSALPTAVFAAATKDYRQSCGEVVPQDEAVTFYALDHCASLIRKSFTVNEPLPEWAQSIMAEYTDVTMAQGTRLLHYIFSIAVREMRHLQSHAHPGVGFWNKAKADFGQPMADFLKLIASNGSETTAVNTYMDHPPAVSAGTYLKALSYGFHKGDGWQGEQQGYGGPKWGRVVDAAAQMVHGEMSLQTLVDIGYSLAHNGGPIFNKPLMYHNQNADKLLIILDAQRAGQIPNLMMDPTNFGGVNKTTKAKHAVQLIAAHLLPTLAHPLSEFQGWVNWVLVDGLRPEESADKKDYPSKYAAHKAAQLKLHPTSAPMKIKTKPVYKVLGGQKMKQVGTFDVFPATNHKPAQSVPTYERVS